MTEYVDKNQIAEGDEVKIEYRGLVSKDWMTVNRDPFGDLYVGEFLLGFVKVTEHRKNFKPLEDAVEAAQKALDKAKADLARAKGLFPEGTRVRWTGFPLDEGTVVAKPADRTHYDDQIWVKWDSCNDILSAGIRNVRIID